MSWKMLTFAATNKQMAGFLFHDVIFGPVRSRRLGVSLGINLLPLHSKFCSFNCIYCECGWTPPLQAELSELPSRKEVAAYLEQRLSEMAAGGDLPDALTYAGNGEPTLHPEFPGIVDDTIALRDRYVPGAKVTVLSNGSMIHDPVVFDALYRLDNNIQKLDAGMEKQFRLINQPVYPFDFPAYLLNMRRFGNNVIIQSLFLRGEHHGQAIDNTREEEVEAWLGHLSMIRPGSVMIYPIARATPLSGLKKIGLEELEKIAEKVRALGIPVQVYQ